MSHVRIYIWRDAPLEQRRAFEGKTRQWLAQVPEGCELGEVNWVRRIEKVLPDGTTLVAGTEQRRKVKRGS